MAFSNRASVLDVLVDDGHYPHPDSEFGIVNFPVPERDEVEERTCEHCHLICAAHLVRGGICRDCAA